MFLRKKHGSCHLRGWGWGWSKDLGEPSLRTNALHYMRPGNKWEDRASVEERVGGFTAHTGK